ncbi:MAG: hypothetical protein HWN65_21025 [Candidatus Helarchaeota archaeon]|nr:hypothetical protein [Candidatus Helarchaeota archaeon]
MASRSVKSTMLVLKLQFGSEFFCCWMIMSAIAANIPKYNANPGMMNGMAISSF